MLFSLTLLQCVFHNITGLFVAIIFILSPSVKYAMSDNIHHNISFDEHLSSTHYDNRLSDCSKV
jgi:hypothetical protein